MGCEKMKPCAFCGGSDCGVLEVRYPYVDQYQGYCEYCGAKTAPKMTFDEAVERWNMRGDDFKPKVDRKLLCAREAHAEESRAPDFWRKGKGDVCETLKHSIRAIELWIEGYGE